VLSVPAVFVVSVDQRPFLFWQGDYPHESIFSIIRGARSVRKAQIPSHSLTLPHTPHLPLLVENIPHERYFGGGIVMDNRSGREQRWKIATIEGLGGCKVDIYACGRTLEEAKKRAGSVEAHVQLSVAEPVESVPLDEGKRNCPAGAGQFLAKGG
jgi:hypothetical protein